MRSARTPSRRVTRASSVAERIAERITTSLPAVGVLLPRWLGSGVRQQRDIGAWLGIGHAATR
jgi:hypothetical protein